MRKVVLSMMVSLDGYIEGVGANIDWHVWGDDMSEYMIDFFTSVDTILFGRKTYELMADFWPTPASAGEDQTIANNMNNLQKVVFSKTLAEVKWNNSRLAKDHPEEEILKLKQQPGKDMVIFGGADITTSFINLGLIDEYRLIINPVILGDGKPLFSGIQEQFQLKLVDTKPFNSGNVLIIYQPGKKHL